MAFNHALDQYRQVRVQTGVQAADPHRLVAMLFEGLVEKILAARLRMAHGGSTAEKGQLISSSMAIIDALHASLDLEHGGEIAANLSNLYDYMGRRLLEGNLRNDTAALDEVVLLVRNIAEAWAAIAPAAGYQAPAEPPRSLSVGA